MFGAPTLFFLPLLAVSGTSWLWHDFLKISFIDLFFLLVPGAVCFPWLLTLPSPHSPIWVFLSLPLQLSHYKVAPRFDCSEAPWLVLRKASFRFLHSCVYLAFVSFRRTPYLKVLGGTL